MRRELHKPIPGPYATPFVSLLSIAPMVLALFLGFAGTSQANTCTLDQGRLQAGRVCLAVKVFAAPSGPGQPLAVIVHGDGGGMIDNQYLARFESTGQRIAEARPSAGVVFVQRPGYRSTLGISQGRAKAEDDDYTRENVDHMAVAVRELRAAWKPSKVVWVGHSGGSALGALVMGRHPGVVDDAVLASCPCGSIRRWREHRNISRGHWNASTWPNSLSPVDHMDGLIRGSRVILITGDRDNNTRPEFSMPWIEKAVARGVEARMVLLPGLGHGPVADVPEIADHAVTLLRE
jgi:pimeloyl-ACP methyl ester carboxylesterase